MPRQQDLEGKRLRLTVFLIKQDYEEVDDFLDLDAGYEVIDIPNGEGVVGQLIYKGGFRSEPSWVSVFEEVEGFDKRGLFNQSSKALYILKHRDRFFCFTFGYSKSLIDSLAYERNFGLIVALNRSDPESVKSIDKTNLSHIALHSREQATRNIEFGNFGFDSDIDILKSITAKVVNDEGEDGEGETVSGRDSVSIYTRVELNTFPEIAESLLAAYTSDRYKTIYPWVDYIQEERDKTVLARLQGLLIENIINHNFDRVWMAIPEVLDWQDVQGFANKRRNNRANAPGPIIRDDLDIEAWVNECRIDERLTFDSLKTRKVYLYWEDGRPVTSYSVFKCLNAEIDLNNEKYILNDCSWYKIETDFVREIDQFYNGIPLSPINLPNFGALNEPEYLIQVTDNDEQYALMDRQTINIGGGRSKVEFCDLYSRNRDVIHVKKYGGSSVLSHLFQQSMVSAESFYQDPEFRRRLNEKLPDGYKLEDHSLIPRPQEYPVHLAIMSKIPGPLELPFFSKVSLKYTVKHLLGMGFPVYKLKIER